MLVRALPCCKVARVHKSRPAAAPGLQRGISCTARAPATNRNRLEQSITFENYLQFKGVRSGVNTLSLEVNRAGAAQVDLVRFYDDSGIVRSPLGPASVKLSVHLPDRDIRAGEAFRLDYSMRHSGEAPVREGIVRVLARPGLTIKGADTHQLHWRKGHDASGTFSLQAVRAGRHPVQVVASAAGSTPAAYLEVAVDESESDRAWFWRPISAASVALLVGAAVAVTLRRRKRGAHP